MYKAMVKITILHEDGSQKIYHGEASSCNIDITKEKDPIYLMGNQDPREYVAGRLTKTFMVSGVLFAQENWVSSKLPETIHYNRFDLEE